MRKLITVIILTVVLFNSCKKDEKKSNTELLTGKYWKITELTVSPSFPVFDDHGNITGYTNDIYAQMEACAQDDIRKYNADGTYIWDAKTKCHVDDIQSGSGTWMFNSDETIITESEDGVSQSYTILELTGSRYKFSYETVLDNTTYTLTITSVVE